MTVKQERYESLIKKEVALVIQNQLNDPSLDFVSVTDVELTNHVLCNDLCQFSKRRK